MVITAPLSEAGVFVLHERGEIVLEAGFGTIVPQLLLLFVVSFCVLRELY